MAFKTLSVIDIALLGNTGKEFAIAVAAIAISPTPKNSNTIRASFHTLAPPATTLKALNDKPFPWKEVIIVAAVVVVVVIVVNEIEKDIEKKEAEMEKEERQQAVMGEEEKE